MSIEKVKRYEPNPASTFLADGVVLHEAEMLECEGSGRYIEYADVAGLVDVLAKLVSHTRGAEILLKVEETETLANARNELARWTP